MKLNRWLLVFLGAVLIALALGIYLLRLTAEQRASGQLLGESAPEAAEPPTEDVAESVKPSEPSTPVPEQPEKLDAQWLIQQVDKWKPGWTAKISPTFFEDPANAFNRFLLAAALMADGRQFQEARDLLGLHEFGWLADPEKVAMIEAYLEANAGALAALKAGIEEAEYYQGPPFFYEESNALLYLDRFRKLACMLRGEALVLHERGQPEGGLVDSLLGLEMAHHVIGGGILIESMVGAFMRHVGGTAFEFVLPEVRDPTLCRQAIAQLDQLLSLDAYRVHDEVHIEAGSVDPGAADLLAVAQDKGREALDILNAALDLPYREFASLSRPADMPPLVAWDSLKAGASTLYRVKASMVAYIALAAIKAHQLERGQFPETLEQLVPEYLTQAPIDPFIGEPLKYVRNGDVATVYSVGFDLEDDHGKRVGSAVEGKGDYVFEVR